MAVFRNRYGQEVDAGDPSLQAQQAPRPPMVQASRFAPQGASTMYSPAARIAQLSQGYAMNPGRAPGGTGNTGLLSNDASGYGQMLQDQREYAGLQDYMGGGTGQLQTKRMADLGSTRTLDTATGRDNSLAFGLPSGVSGAAIEGLFNATDSSGNRVDPNKVRKFIAGNRYGRTTG